MENKKLHWKKLIRIVLGAILAFVLVATVGIAIFVNSTLNKINRVGEEATLSPEQIQAILAETDPKDYDIPTNPMEEQLPTDLTENPEAEAASPTEAISVTEAVTEFATEEPTQIQSEIPTEEVSEIPPSESEEPSDVVNILLIGQDRRQHETRQRSDAMILCTINAKARTLVMTSFMRDTYVELPVYHGGYYGKNRLNVPYLIGGFEMLNDCLELNFGVHVDHNIEVDFSGFKNVVDALGGVDIELTQGEARIVEGDLQEGMNHLDGGQALMYARIRKLDDDFGRTDRQRKVLSALFEKTREMGIREVLKLVDAVIPMITTDMETSDIIGYITKFYPIWSELEIVTQSLPGKGEFRYEMIDGMSVVIPFMNKVRQKIAETIQP